MSEYRNQIVTASAVAVVVILAAAIGIYYLPLQTSSSTGTSPTTTAATRLTSSTSTSSSSTSTWTTVASMIIQPNHTIPLGQGPDSMLYYPDNNVLLIASTGLSYPFTSTLYVFNITTNQVIESVSLGTTTSNSHSLAYDPASHEVYVSINPTEQNTCCATRVLAINTDYQTVATINISQSIAGEVLMQYDAANQEMFLSMLGIDYVLAINSTNQLVANVTANWVLGLAYDPLLSEMYVSNGNSGVSVIDANNSIIDLINIGLPEAITYDPANGYIYVISQGGVEALNGTTEIGSYTLVNGSQSFSFTFSFNSQNDELYVSSFGWNTITVINKMDQVVANIKIASSGGIYDAKHNWMLFSTGDNLTLINSNNEIVGFATFPNAPLQQEPFWATMLYVPQNGCSYVLSFENDTVSAFC